MTALEIADAAADLAGLAYSSAGSGTTLTIPRATPYAVRQAAKVNLQLAAQLIAMAPPARDTPQPYTIRALADGEPVDAEGRPWGE